MIGYSLTLRSNDPRNTPSGQSEALGKAIDNQDIVLVNILDVLGGRDGRTIAVAGVVVSRVELVTDKGGAASAKILNLGQLRVGNDSAGRVAGVGGKDDGGTTGDFLGNLVGVDVVAVLFGEGHGDGRELYHISAKSAQVVIHNPSKIQQRLTFLNRLSISLYAV
jgi:hypothetical protein